MAFGFGDVTHGVGEGQGELEVLEQENLFQLHYAVAHFDVPVRDLRNQLALAYEGDSENLSKKLRTGKTVEDIFRGAQASFNAWAKLPPEERTARAILDSLDFDFFELLDSVTIARSRKHIQTFYDTRDIGQFPERRKPLSFHSPLTQRTDVMSFNEIFEQLSLLKLAVYAPITPEPPRVR